MNLSDFKKKIIELSDMNFSSEIAQKLILSFVLIFCYTLNI